MCGRLPYNIICIKKKKKLYMYRECVIQKSYIIANHPCSPEGGALKLVLT